MVVGGVKVASVTPIRMPGEDGIITIEKGPARVKTYLVSNRGKPLFMVTWFVAGRQRGENLQSHADRHQDQRWRDAGADTCQP